MALALVLQSTAACHTVGALVQVPLATSAERVKFQTPSLDDPDRRQVEWLALYNTGSGYSILLNRYYPFQSSRSGQLEVPAIPEGCREVFFYLVAGSTLYPVVASRFSWATPVEREGVPNYETPSKFLAKATEPECSAIVLPSSTNEMWATSRVRVIAGSGQVLAARELPRSRPFGLQKLRNVAIAPFYDALLVAEFPLWIWEWGAWAVSGSSM